MAFVGDLKLKRNHYWPFSEMKHLEGISLSYLYLIEEVSSISGTYCLGKLREVDIDECGSITHLTRLRYAPLLEFLYVGSCRSMEEVVKGGQHEDVGIDSFSNLSVLKIY